jgi:hypothetical protein
MMYDLSYFEPQDLVVRAVRGNFLAIFGAAGLSAVVAVIRAFPAVIGQNIRERAPFLGSLAGVGCLLLWAIISSVGMIHTFELLTFGGVVYLMWSFVFQQGIALAMVLVCAAPALYLARPADVGRFALATSCAIGAVAIDWLLLLFLSVRWDY